MNKKLKVEEFTKKQELLDFVNQFSESLDILSISSSQEGIYYKHFLWYYEKQ